ALIDLNKVLKNYTCWESKQPNAQLAIAINERMAYIYINDEKIEQSDIVNILTKDERIGFIAWKEGQKNYVVRPQSEKALTFVAKGPYVDEYEQSWTIDGDSSILDLKLINGRNISYQNYP